MYAIDYFRDPKTQLHYVVMESSEKKAYAKICLDWGASVQEVRLANHPIIADMSPLTYDTTYASSILFPFANRVKQGKYTYKDQSYQFEINELGNNNALHGLVFNKSFICTDTKANEQSATVVLEYNETETAIGFPYTYCIQLRYTLSDANLELQMVVKNTDSKAFPFTLGWHPYFTSSNLDKSRILFDSSEKIILDKHCITTGIEETNTENDINLADLKLDDCWVLNTNTIHFITPEYKLTLNSTGDTNFLQLFTPPKQNRIAIEPTTGVSDSFNNKIGLQVLNPNHSYAISWTVKIEPN